MTEENTETTSDSVENTQKELYIEIEDGATPSRAEQPKRKIGQRTVKGIVVGRGENKAVINITDVKKLAALHLTYRDMAEFFGCKETTFRDHFRLVVEQSRQRTKQRLMEAMLTNAIDKMNPTVQIWLSKNLLGFSDNPINTTEDTVLPWLDDTDE